MCIACMCVYVICVYAQRGLLYTDSHIGPLEVRLLKLLLSCECEFENGKISLGSLYIFTYMGLYMVICVYSVYMCIMCIYVRKVCTHAYMRVISTAGPLVVIYIERKGVKDQSKKITQCGSKV